MASTGDMITTQEIRAVMCPVHGEYCEASGPFTPCRARIQKAIVVKHAKRTATCGACRSGSGYHAHFG